VLIAALSNGTLFLERETSPGIWETVASDSFNILVAGLGTVASIDLAEVTLDEGTYRARATLSGTLVNVSATVTTEVDVIYLDQFEVESVNGDSGNLLANDEPGSEFTTLQIFDGTSFVDVTGSVQVQGALGVLTVDADGNYSYTPDADLNHFDIAQQDVFTYQLVHPVSGAVEAGSLNVTVEPSGAGVPEGMMAMFSNDVVGFDSGTDQSDADDPFADGPPPDRDRLALLLDDGKEDQTVPLNGLAGLAPDKDDEVSDDGADSMSAQTGGPLNDPSDPFGHLVAEDEWHNNGSPV
jgi:VCBS repeat-containing protein